MFDKNNIVINLPDPIKCTNFQCSGMLVPIFRPTAFLDYGLPLAVKRYYAKRGINEVIWKCTQCKKVIDAK